MTPIFSPAVGHFEEKNHPSTFNDFASLIKEQKDFVIVLR
jgi:hypothetical protein